MIWDLDCHYPTIEKRGCHLLKEFESFLGFNDPKASKHQVGPFKPMLFSSYVVKMYQHLDKNYLEKDHMKKLKINIERTLETISKYIQYLETQRSRNEVEKDPSHDGIESFIISKIRTVSGCDLWRERFKRVSDKIQQAEFYTPIHINNLITYSTKQQIYLYIKQLNWSLKL